MTGMSHRPTRTGRRCPPSPTRPAAALGDSQLRRNLAHATATIRDQAGRRRRRARRLGGAARRPARRSRTDTLATSTSYLVQLEERGHQRQAATCTGPGTPPRPTAIVADLVRATGVDEVVKVKSMATQEIGLNEALGAAGIAAWETDLAELIVQLGDDRPCHILVPAIHRNRAEIREIFRRGWPRRAAPGPHRRPARAGRGGPRCTCARSSCAPRSAISGANFAVAETGHAGRRRVRGQRPDVPDPARDADLGGRHREGAADLAATSRSSCSCCRARSTGERMNPYTSIWTGVTPGDGPQEFHVVLLDNGRTDALADKVGRQALRCIRCSACLNVCPVYERAGGHAYGSVYPGPIGAILTPQLRGVESTIDASLPFASIAVRRLLRGVPGRDRHPRGAGAPAGPGGRGEGGRARSAERGRDRLPRPTCCARRGGWPRRSASPRSGGWSPGGRGRIRGCPPPLSRAGPTRATLPTPPPESFRAWWARTREPAGERAREEILARIRVARSADARRTDAA